MAAYLVACRKFLTCRGIEIHPHEAQAGSMGLFKPIHDGRGLRSGHSVIGVEEEQTWTDNSRRGRRGLAASASAQRDSYKP